MVIEPLLVLVAARARPALPSVRHPRKANAPADWTDTGPVAVWEAIEVAALDVCTPPGMVVVEEFVESGGLPPRL